MSASPPKADIGVTGHHVRFGPDISQFRAIAASAPNRNGWEIVTPSASAVVRLITRLNRWAFRLPRYGRLRRCAGPLGLLAWQIILIVAQPGWKRDPDASPGEPPAFGQIIEDHFGRVFV